jgi:hypothetical protein
MYDGYRAALSPGIKRPMRDADYSSPSSAEIKNEQILKGSD